MRVLRLSRILPSILVLCLVGLFVVVTPIFATSAKLALNSAASRAALPAISTSCPAPGTARAAVMPSLTLGTHPNIVYIVNEGTQASPTAGTLKRYDIVTGGKVEIVKLAHTYIAEAQVSRNGQWLLFVAQVSGRNKLQLVRMDGKFLQTLYCGNPSEVQWSTSQQLALFTDLVSGHIDLLNLTSGVLQTELSFSRGVSLHSRTWLDNTRAYITVQFTDAPPQKLIVLDTSKGPNQNYQNLPVAFDSGPSTPFCWDFDSSYNGKSLFVSQCTAKSLIPAPGEQPCCGPSVITNHSPTDGLSYSYVYVNQSEAFLSVRAVTAKTLLFIVDNTDTHTGQNGVWKVGTDGSSPQRLASSGEFNQFTQFPWSNVSRDGTKYALQITYGGPSHNTFTLEYGSLSGGSPIVFASITNVQLATVGWTTM